METSAVFMVHFVHFTAADGLEELEKTNWSPLDDQQILYLVGKMGSKRIMTQVSILCLKLQHTLDHNSILCSPSAILRLAFANKYSQLSLLSTDISHCSLSSSACGQRRLPFTLAGITAILLSKWRQKHREKQQFVQQAHSQHKSLGEQRLKYEDQLHSTPMPQPFHPANKYKSDSNSRQIRFTLTHLLELLQP